MELIRFNLTLLCFLTLFSSSVFANQKNDFDSYLKQLKAEAKQQGIQGQTLERVFPKIKRFKKAVAKDKSQPETQMTLETYIPRVVPEWKVEKARSLYKLHHAELIRIGKQYGVQPRFIVALWGIESNFGKLTGTYPILSVTASLAFEGRREAFFKKEFFAALKIAEQNNLPFEALTGSWAGAMGQTQFMPTSYLAYARDGDGDGKKDIWHNINDTFASIAYFLQQTGWHENQTWGRQVTLPKGFDVKLAGLTSKKSLSEWQSLGVRRFGGQNLPARGDLKAALVMPDGVKGRKYLVYDNYQSLMRWNKSLYFATSVTHLSERIKFPAIL